jgi:hypothetical protein
MDHLRSVLSSSRRVAELPRGVSSPLEIKELSSSTLQVLILFVLLTGYRHSLSMKHVDSYFESLTNQNAVCKYFKIIIQYVSDTFKYRVVQEECEVLSQVVSCYNILMNFQGP